MAVEELEDGREMLMPEIHRKELRSLSSELLVRTLELASDHQEDD